MKRPRKGQYWMEQGYDEDEPVLIAGRRGDRVVYHGFPLSLRHGLAALNDMHEKMFIETFRPATEEEVGLFRLKYSP